MATTQATPDPWAKLDVPVVTQKQTKWCWAASCESFTGFYSKRLKSQNEYILLCSQGFQESLVEKVHGARDINQFAIPTEYLKYLKDVMGANLNLCEPGRGQDQRPPRDTIKGTLMGGRIFIFSSANHARILCGYGVKPRGTEDGIYCMDPAVGSIVWEPWSLYDQCTSLIWVPKSAGI